MRFLLSCVFLLVSLPTLALASVTTYFEKIKSDPNALYAFLKAMPKGGELHYHLSGGAYPETMLAVAAKGNYCLNQDTFVMSTILQICEGINASEISLNQALYDRTIRAWSLKNFIPGVESGHDHFFAAFYKFGALVATQPVPLLADVMQRAADQNEQYMEIMVKFDDAKTEAPVLLPVIPDNFNEIKQSLLSDSAFVTDIDKIVKVADSLLPEARKYLDCDKLPEQPVCHMSIKFQYYVLRNQPLEKLFPQALHAFAAASQSKAIVGVNLVQAEDGFISLRDYRKQMQVFDFLHQAYPEVHIALHAGELSSTDVIPENLRFHINDAIKVGHAERIGHGVDIAFEDNADALVNYMASKPIPVEINLVSNEKILNVYGKKHPLRYYLNHNVPVVLSTDDEGILRTDLTHQYVDAIRQHGVNYPTVKMINRNVLTYSFLPGDSLWQNSALAQPVAACTDLNSPACLQFVAKSEKASLQRNLELKLKEFEAIYE